jgi:hypothetical protein
MRYLTGAILSAVLVAAGIAVAQSDLPNGWLAHTVEHYINGSGEAQGDIDLDTNTAQLILDAGAAANPSIVFGDDDDGTGTGIYRSAANKIGFAANGSLRAYIGTTGFIANGTNIDLNGNYIYDSGDQLDIGGACTDGHSQGTGDVCIAGTGQVDGNLWADSNLTVGGNADVEGFAAIGNGSAPAASSVALIVDRDTGTSAAANQLRVLGRLTATGGSSDLVYLLVAPEATTLNDGGPNVHDTIASVEIREPTITETVGTVTNTASLKILDAATEGDNNYALWVDAGTSRFDGVVNVAGGGTKGALTMLKTITESVTFAANPGDASKITSGDVIPAGAFVTGVTTRTTTAATNCTDVDIGIAGTDLDMFADGTAVAANTTTDNTDANSGADWGASILPSFASQEITVTANGGNCFDGVWAITVHYIDTSAATSN